MPRPGSRRPAPGLAAGLAALLLACGGAPDPSPQFGSAESTGDHVPPTYRPSGHAAAGDALIEMFQWPWNDLARECAWIGQAGYRAVQVSPPQEHERWAGNPWWVVYTAVSYRLESRMGTAAEFQSMVDACRAAGVDVYVDVVLNHTTPATLSGTGSGGTAFTPYHHPDYTPLDFHVPCPLAESNDLDPDGRMAERTCQDYRLADLDTGSAHVRQVLAGYLITLNRMGVNGYRVDSANYVSADDLDAILALVNEAAVAEGRERPFVTLEAWDAPAAPQALYLGVGYASGGAADVMEWPADAVFLYFADPARHPPSALADYPEGWGLLPADKAEVFVSNHDDERRTAWSYKNVRPYRLATLFQLASPYGYVQVQSSYAFTDVDAGPPSDAEGRNLPVYVGEAPACRHADWLAGAALPDGAWICQHRDPGIAGMVRFRRQAAGEPQVDFQAPRPDLIGFGRGAAGFVVFNGGGQARTATWQTRLAPGTYCDLLTGGRVGDACAGVAYTVAADGSLTATFAAQDAVALGAAARLP